jgi:hypothetical protein
MPKYLESLEEGTCICDEKPLYEKMHDKMTNSTSNKMEIGDPLCCLIAEGRISVIFLRKVVHQLPML